MPDTEDPHVHCRQCILLRCDQGCPLNFCKEKCGAAYHACKDAEHANFCPNMLVPCINKLNGCPQQNIRRSDMSQHLDVCPANVVSCAFFGGEQQEEEEEPSSLFCPLTGGQKEVAFAMNDIKTFIRKFNRGISDKQEEEQQQPPLTPQTPVSDMGGFPFKKKESIKQRNSYAKGEPVSSMKNVTYYSRPECQQVFQRSYYTWHVKNMHSEILEGLNGWFFRQCPLSREGCTCAGKQRLSPNAKQNRLIYNPVLKCYDVRPHLLDASPEAEDSSSGLTLTELPVDILELIAGYLNGASLNSFALTCQNAMFACYNVLTKKGVVVLNWKKNQDDDKCSWTIDKQLWAIPNDAPKIESWVMNEPFTMLETLKACDLNDRTNYSEKVRLVFPDIKPDGTTESIMTAYGHHHDPYSTTFHKWIIHTISNDHTEQPIWKYVSKQFDYKMDPTEERPLITE